MEEITQISNREKSQAEKKVVQIFTVDESINYTN
jgi:hypothetical protein